MVFYNNTDELRHYGVPGMKKGVRKAPPPKSNMRQPMGAQQKQQPPRAPGQSGQQMQPPRQSAQKQQPPAPKAKQKPKQDYSSTKVSAVNPKTTGKGKAKVDKMFKPRQGNPPRRP